MTRTIIYSYKLLKFTTKKNIYIKLLQIWFESYV